MTAHLQLVRPGNENRSVRTRRRTPTRPRNRDLRPREYLTPSEVETLIRIARKGRHGHRDATLILVAYRHGLRAIELCDLEWSQVEFDRTATLHVRWAKNGKPAVHPIRGDELRALRELQRQTRGRLRNRTWHPIHHRCRQSPGQAHRPARQLSLQDPRSHAAARLRLRPSEPRTRHPGHSGLARPPRHSAYCPLH
jgi:integrase